MTLPTIKPTSAEAIEALGTFLGNCPSTNDPRDACIYCQSLAATIRDRLEQMESDAHRHSETLTLFDNYRAKAEAERDQYKAATEENRKTIYDLLTERDQYKAVAKELADQLSKADMLSFSQEHALTNYRNLTGGKP